MRMGRLTRSCVVLVGTVALALGTSASALVVRSSLTLTGPHVNTFGTSFHYTASGSTHGAANFVYGWESPFSETCASTYKAESKHASLALFVSRALAKNKRFSFTIPFFARNTEQHRFCAYVIKKASGETFAHAATSWKNVPAGSSATAPSAGGSLKPTPVGEGHYVPASTLPTINPSG
jgi:hypothetical protein